MLCILTIYYETNNSVMPFIMHAICWCTLQQILYSVVYNNCTSEVGGVVVGVAHGDYIVDFTKCQRCLCDNGYLEDCQSPLTCRSIQRNPISCTFSNKTIPHGKKFNVHKIVVYSRRLLLVNHELRPQEL